MALGPLYGPRPVVWPSARLEKLARLRMAEGTRNSRTVHGPPPGSAELYPGPGTRNSRSVHGPRCQLCAGRRTPRYADGRSEENDFALLQTELLETRGTQILETRGTQISPYAARPVADARRKVRSVKIVSER